MTGQATPTRFGLLLLLALAGAAVAPSTPVKSAHKPAHKTAPKVVRPPALIVGARDVAAQKLKQAEQARAAKLAVVATATKEQSEAAVRAAALAQQRVDAAAKLRAIESRVGDAAEQLQEATEQEKTAQDGVEERAADLTALLPVALRLSQYPAETLLAAPVPADKALQGLLATKGLSAELTRQVTDFRAQQAEAEKLKQAVAHREAVLAAERARQAHAATQLDRQLSAAQDQQQQAGDDSAEAAQAAAVLASRADDLRSAIAAMDQAEKEAAARAAVDADNATRLRQQQQAASARARQLALARPAGPGLPAPTAALAMPKATLVAGRLVRGFGAASEDGPTTGITFSAAPAAFVASPCTGRVGFAAPFRSFGKLMIIECGGGYDFVLAGMDRLDVPVGRAVRPGEPLGRMPDYDAHAADRPGLYVELRHHGQAVDPMPYLNGKG